MSLARGLYGRLAAPQLLQAFVDDAVLIEYEFGNVLKQCRGIVRDVRVVLVPGDDGVLEKQTLGSLAVLTDECSVYGGILDPQVKATIKIYDQCGVQSLWSIASDENANAIISRDATFVVMSIKQTRAAAVSSKNYRR